MAETACLLPINNFKDQLRSTIKRFRRHILQPSIAALAEDSRTSLS